MGTLRPPGAQGHAQLSLLCSPGYWMGFFLSRYWMVFPFFGACGGFTAEPRCAPVCAAVLVRGCSHVQPHCGICQIASIFFSPLSRKSAPLQGWKIMPDTTAHATHPGWSGPRRGAEKSPGMGGMGINPPSLQPGFLGMLRPPADPRASPTPVCSAAGLGVNFAGFSPPRFAALLRDCVKHL